MPQFIDVGRVGRENAAVKITTAAATDADAVAELHTASWRTAYATLFPAQYLDGPLLAERQQVWRARLADPVPGAALFLAVETNVVLGFIYLEPQPDGRVLLDNLHARPGDTGRGLGSRLLEHALAWSSTAHPGKDVYLEVLQGNARAVAFYERHGGRRTASRICRFDQGFELPEFEYTWPATVRAPTRSPARR
uniref:GNAT family N-acetyltransferase n=1 Tax=Streptomyces sp. NBC_01001 TaxID=2903713 RepID=UPI002F91647B